MSAETQSQWAAGTGYVPVNTGALEVAPLSETYANDRRFRVAYDQLLDGETNAATAGPVLGPLAEIRVIVASALQDILSGGGRFIAFSGSNMQAAPQMRNVAR